MSFSRETVAKSFLWKLFERFSVQIIQFVVTIVLARLIVPSEYGIISLIAIFIQLCEVIIEGGLNTALVQKKDADNKDFSTIFFFSVGVSFLLYWVMFFAAIPIARFYSQPTLVPVIRILSVNLLFYAINSIQRAYVSKHMLFGKLFYSSFFSVILSGIIGITMAYKGFGVYALVAQAISNQLFTTIIMAFTVRWRPDFVFSGERFKPLFGYGWKIFGTSFIITLFVNARKLVIGKFFQPATLAFYEKGDQIPSLVMSNIFTSIQAILFPVFSEDQDDRPRIKSMMKRSTKMSCLVIYPLLMGLIVVAEPLVSLLLTDKWLPAVPFIRILCISYFFMPITLSNWEAIKAMGYSDITLKLEILKKVIDVIILVVSVFYGVYAIAWGAVLYNFICLFINLWPNKKLLDYSIREQISAAVPSLLISLVMGAAIYWMHILPISRLALLSSQIVLGAIVYILICYLIKEESFMYLLGLLKNNYKRILFKRS